MKKQKRIVKLLPSKGKILYNQRRPVKRAAFFHRIGNRHS